MISPQKMQLEEFKTFGKCHLERVPTFIGDVPFIKVNRFQWENLPLKCTTNWNPKYEKIFKNESEKLTIWKLCRSYVRWLRRKRLGSKLWGYFLSISSNVFLVNLIKHISFQSHKWIFLVFFYFFVNLILSILSFLNSIGSEQFSAPSPVIKLVVFPKEEENNKELCWPFFCFVIIKYQNR